MQNIIVEKPYRFIAPHRGDLIPYLIQRARLVDWYLSRFEGITSHEVRNADRLINSVREGAGILLAPNHCRYADPIAMGWIARVARIHVYAMASWHLFHQGRLQAFAIRMCGGFSVNREGLDRQSLDTAIDILVEAQRPLVIFPEGTVFRTNDRLNPLLDGVAFLARTAARRRAKAGQGKVVVHPVAIKYLFKGDLKETIEPVLSSIEQRLTWGSQSHHSLLCRVHKVGEALLTLKEIQYLGHGQVGTLGERKERLIERLLTPLDERLLGRKQSGSLVPRIKQLRAKLVPRLTQSDTSQTQRSEIWQSLGDIYDAQQIWSYPEGYLDQPTDTRLLETVERYEEDLLDRARIHRPLHAILEVGEAIDADAPKPRAGQSDPILSAIENQLRSMLDKLSGEATALETNASAMGMAVDCL